jgi:hypothetical protein
MELAITPLLRSLVAKHRTHVPQTLRLVIKQAVFFTGADATGCPFRAQRDAFAIAIIEGIHLFLDDVRDFADGTFEQVCGFQNGKANLLIAVALENIGKGTFDVLPIG